MIRADANVRQRADFRNISRHDRQSRCEIFAHFERIGGERQFVYLKWIDRNVKRFAVGRQLSIGLSTKAMYIRHAIEDLYFLFSIHRDLADENNRATFKM